MVQLDFLSAYGLFELIMHFQKGDANGHPKVESVANITILYKQVGSRRHFGFLHSANSLVCSTLSDVGKLQKFRKLQNFDTEAAEIRTTFSLSTYLET